MVAQLITPDLDVQDRLVPFDQNVHSKTFFEDAIAAEWRSSVAGIIRTGDLLIQAEDELGRDVFCALRLPFSSKVAQMLRRIAANAFISDRRNHGSLPPCWRTLYELCKASDDVLEAARLDGRLHSDLQRKDVRITILGLPPRPTRKADDPVAARSAINSGDMSAVNPARPDPVTTVSAGLRALTEEQLTAVWSEFTLHGFLATMPKRWWSELERRITGSRREPALLKESEVLRQALGQIRIAAHATDTNAAEIAENLALTALRSLATSLVDVDIDRITIVNRYAKEKRCAKEKRAKKKGPRAT
jgi:hypothetical protein